MVIFLFLVGGSAIWLSSEIAITVLEIVIWPLMMYIFSAYGMDWITKQTDFVGSRYSVKNNGSASSDYSNSRKSSVSN